MYNVSYYHKEKSLFYYLFVTLQQYSLSNSTALFSLSNSTALLSLPNSPALLSLLFVARQSRGALHGSNVGRCAAVTWGVARQTRGALRGRCAAVLRNPVMHRLLIGRQPLRGSHAGRCAAVTWGVARPLRGSTP